MNRRTLAKRAVAEFMGTGFLVAAVVGSGIMAEQLSGNNVAIALLANTIATGAALCSLILAFGPISGAHFNPAVTLADAMQGGIRWSDVALYITAQVTGGLMGTVVAHMMFALPVYSMSLRERHGFPQMLSEFVAAFGLLAVIWGCSRQRSGNTTPFAVASYIMAAYWFTASTSFANPAVTIARAFSNTFSGIRPLDVPGFVVAQILGAVAATIVFRWLIPSLPETAETLVVPRQNMQAGVGTKP